MQQRCSIDATTPQQRLVLRLGRVLRGCTGLCSYGLYSHGLYKLSYGLRVVSVPHRRVVLAQLRPRGAAVAILPQVLVHHRRSDRAAAIVLSEHADGERRGATADPEGVAIQSLDKKGNRLSAPSASAHGALGGSPFVCS